MLITNLKTIGNNLYEKRRKMGLTQIEVADLSGLSDRAYADIERGTVNMKVGTLLSICHTLRITPNDILVEDKVPVSIQEKELLVELDSAPAREKQTALQLLAVYLQSLSS